MALTDKQMAQMMAVAQMGYAPNSISFADQATPSTLNPVGYGACDADANNYKQALENWRYSTVYFKLVRDGGTGDLTLAAESEVSAFNGGGGNKSGDNVSTSGLPGTVALSNVETDLFPTGAPTKQNAMFRMKAIGIAILAPFTLADPFTVKRYDRWIENYKQPIIDILHNNVAWGLEFDAEECNWIGGLVGMYPQHANSTGAGSIVRNGAGIGIANLMPLRTPADLGAQDRANQATITLKTSNFDLVVGNDPVVPTEADLYVPFQVIAYGAQLCEPCSSSSCYNELMALVAAQPPSVQQQMMNALKGG